jgi:hypothetical protein
MLWFVGRLQVLPNVNRICFGLRCRQTTFISYLSDIVINALAICTPGYVAIFSGIMIGIQKLSGRSKLQLNVRLSRSLPCTHMQ